MANKNKKRSSTNDDKQPYMRLGFRMNTSNHFWETEMYSEKSKEYFRNLLCEAVKKERLFVNLQ